ncbi:MAG TPA: hypothetical protein GXX70_09615 [Tepidimicrobium sp.]|jgi:hypothetical protein|nr:hypothetical protein [Tepidimicrobium sp.]
MPNIMINKTLLKCHGCDGKGWVEVASGAVLCPVCQGAGELSSHIGVPQVGDVPNPYPWGTGIDGIKVTWGDTMLFQ